MFLPAAGNRNGTDVNDVGDNGNYWSSTANENDEFYAFRVYFNFNYGMSLGSYVNRNHGQSVRLVR